jgi:drug/metabolite transporter (DMT)-like permease
VSGEDGVPLAAMEAAGSGSGRASSAGKRARGVAALWGAGLVVASAVAFSAKAVVAKRMYAEGVDAITTLSLRMAFAAPVYVVVAFWSSRGARALTGRERLGIAVLGGGGYYGSAALDFVGLHYVSAGLERLILFTYPTIVVLLSALALGEPVRKHQVAALVMTYAGIALVLRSELDSSGANAALDGNVALGSALIFASSVLYASYLVGSTSLIRRLGSRRFTALALLAATTGVLLQCALSGRSLRGHTGTVYGLGLLMGLMCTVFPTFALAEGIQRLGPGPSAILGTVGPVSTLFLAYWVLGEPITALQVGGTALVLAGATAVAWRSR